MNEYNLNRPASLIWQLIAYTFAIMIAIYAYEHLPLKMEVIWKLLISNILATSVIFFFSYAFKNASLYDPYWSIQPIVITFFLLAQEQVGVDITRQTIVTLLILVWGIRSTWNFIRGWEGIQHEDWRYIKLRDTFGKWFLLISFLGIMIMPTVLIFLCCIPMIDALQLGEYSFGAFDVIATVICLTGIIFEWISDDQLKKFRLNRTDLSEIINKGLWKYSRHPNYFGEILFWIGIAIFGASAHGDIEWFHLLGMTGMILLFNFISIPMQEKYLVDHKPEYRNEIKIRSKLFPLPPRD